MPPATRRAPWLRPSRAHLAPLREHRGSSTSKNPLPSGSSPPASTAALCENKGMSHHQRTVIIYHGKCPDGFGGAYAAWKKFGETAEYIPMSYGSPIPEHMDGRNLYFVDFCLEQEKMDALAKVAKSLVVLDHHAGVRAVATSFPGVFDVARSGASIAWAYFHPDTPVPYFIQMLEDY